LCSCEGAGGDRFALAVGVFGEKAEVVGGVRLQPGELPGERFGGAGAAGESGVGE
jgi:hypothetical protein